MRVAGAVVTRFSGERVGGGGVTVGGSGVTVGVERRKPRVAGAIARTVSVRWIRHGGGGRGRRRARVRVWRVMCKCNAMRFYEVYNAGGMVC